jgi:light-harvesting complex 1 beta chain
MADNGGSLTGLTDQQAQEFHEIFMRSFMIFLIVAVVAHILVWFWRPWLPSVDGYAAAALETGTNLAQLATALV